MKTDKNYYEAYDDRYKQVHEKSLKWFTDTPSKIVEDVLKKYQVPKTSNILEIGCGEGRDASYLLNQNYNILATDISPAAIGFCKIAFPEFADSFRVLDCLSQRCEERFGFIYAVAVLHMLVLDEHRKSFYEFIYGQLAEDGIALICTMGDGEEEWQSNIDTAFDLQDRTHGATGTVLKIAGTSFRKVSFDTFHRELKENGFQTLESGITEIIPDFPVTMYAVVKKKP